MRIACVSNISVGYGTPQILYLLRSLRELIEGTAPPTLLEIDQPERPPRHDLFPDLDITRIYTLRHPQSREGSIQYINEAAAHLNKERPEVLVIPSTYSLPVLWLLSYAPRIVVYYVLEMPETLIANCEQVQLNQHARRWVDVALYPEINRARIHIDTFGYHAIPSAVICNAIPHKRKVPVPVQKRNGRILYQGTIHEELTSAKYFLDDDVQRIPIDLYGIVDSDSTDFDDKIRRMNGNVIYCGYVDNASLAEIRANYSFSIIYWNPINDNQLYACPNKFFESLADGIPVITAPHPQTKTLTERYACGLVMPDWSLDSFISTLKEALGLIHTPRYAEMVKNCRRAHNEELHWEIQFEKVKLAMRSLFSAEERQPKYAESPKLPQLSGGEAL